MSDIEFIHYSYREDVGTEMINRPENLEANCPIPPKDKQPSGCYLAPNIHHGDSRPVPEIWPALICGCGRKVRYITVNGDSQDNACNKYGRCKPYSELLSEVEQVREQNKLLLNVSEKSFNLVLAHKESGFAAMNGGIETLQKEHEEAVGEYQAYMAQQESLFEDIP